jgi:hypothetical protein
MYVQHSVRNLCCINNTAHFNFIVISATQQTRFKIPNGQYKCFNSDWKLFNFWIKIKIFTFNPLNAELNPICHLLVLLGADPILHISRIRVKQPLRYEFSTHRVFSIHHQIFLCMCVCMYVCGWSENFSASTIDGNTIGKIFFLSWYICHKYPCEIASHSIKQFVLYSCLKQECCLYPLKWVSCG